MLPYSLPIMAAIALSPRLWRRLMDRRAARMAAAGENSHDSAVGA